MILYLYMKLENIIFLVESIKDFLKVIKMNLILMVKLEMMFS